MRLTLTLLILAFAGCKTHIVLRDHTLDTSGTLADLNCQQVLDNVARFVSNSSTLPSVAVFNSGSVIVSDQGSFNGAGTYSPTIWPSQQSGGFPIFSAFLNPNLSRNLTENWGMVPVTDINKIRRLRCAFQLLVCGYTCSNCEDCLKTLDGFFPTDPEKLPCAIPVGWYGVGCEEDVPDNACYVGNYEDTYVWVTSDGIEGLTRFTMTVMQLSTSDRDDPKKVVVKKYNAEGELESTEVTTEEVDEDAAKSDDVKESGTHMRSAANSIKRKMPRVAGLSPKQTALSPKQARKRAGF